MLKTCVDVVPIGTPLGALVKAAGGPDSLGGYTLIVGGPATGKLCGDFSEPVLKTTGGVIVLKSTHPDRKSGV